ncbi:MAG: substrate-binding domain-containing protein [Desulfobacterales bacterium]|nr:substrate-binding domain-containing protein [Desulfobacterales bacterium]
MKKLGIKLFIAVLTIYFFGGIASAGDKIIKMSTTTSTQASGLLDILLPELEKDTGIQVKVIAKGTGAAIRDGMDGNVDVIFVHAKAREDKFVHDGYGTKRYAVMHNDFVILGPQKDPAAIKGLTHAAAALKKIAAVQAGFVSRGDDSGTHSKEQALWKSTALPLEKMTQTIVKKGKKKEVRFVRPQGQWYLSIGQGMGKALTFADEKQAYILADRGTYIKYKFGRDVPIDLVVLCEGDPALANPYGVIPISPQKHPHVKYDLSKSFAEWLVSSKGQTVINNYRLLGKQLFYPDAVK